jgi:hypothetical protein
MTTNQRKVNILYVCNASNIELNHRIKKNVLITDGRNYDNLAIEVFGPGRNFEFSLHPSAGLNLR